MVSNKADAYGLVRANKHRFRSGLSSQKFSNNLEMDDAIGDYLQSLAVDLIVLAGYMKMSYPQNVPNVLQENFKYPSFFLNTQAKHLPTCD